ncbi:MAG: CotH kinase family protein [Verrucomicrobiota bacterium]
MNSPLHPPFLRRSAGLALGLFLARTALSAAPKGPGPDQGKLAADLFADRAPAKITIQIPDAAVETLRNYHWDPGKSVEREAVLVTVREGDVVYPNVALHLKGAAGSFRSIDDRPAMTLNFDRFAKGQHFHGLTKLSLNNSVQDTTLISEQLSRELYTKAGVPTPRATRVLVELNGRDLGLYVLTEGWDRDFLKRHFKNPKGNLYDGGFLKDVTNELSVNSGDENDQSPRIALANAAKEPDLTQRQAALEKTLDVDRFISLLALDVLLWNWDGYALNRNNWRLFHDRATGRMVFMPHGLDQMFWNAEGSVLPPMEGLVAKAVLQVPAFRQRYFARLKQLQASVFQASALTDRAQAIAATFVPLLKEKYPETAAEQAKALTDYCDAMVRRARSVEQQLAQPIHPLSFDQQGYARVTGWEAKNDFGFPLLTNTPDQQAVHSLQIGSAQGSSVGSWRAKVWLENGKYRLEGRIKTHGIVADPGDPRAGAGVRTARSKPENYLLGDTDWKPLDYEFSVDDPLVQVQVICEFRGAEGQAWFDLDALRLKKDDAASH